MANCVPTDLRLDLVGVDELNITIGKLLLISTLGRRIGGRAVLSAEDNRTEKVLQRLRDKLTQILLVLQRRKRRETGTDNAYVHLYSTAAQEHD